MLQGLYNGLSGLRTSQLALDVAGANIANVNTKGYQKRIFYSESNPSIVRHNNTLGTGVTDQPIKRAHNEMIFSNLKNSLSQLNSDSAYKNGLSTLNDKLTNSVNSKTDLNSLISNMYSSLEKLSEQPINKSLQIDFKDKLSSVLERKNNLINSLDSSIKEADIKINDTRDNINKKLNEFDSISQSIAEYEAANGPKIKNRYLNEMRDKRDLVEQELSELGSFRVQKTTQGSGKYNVSDEGNKIYSREVYETSGQINGLKEVKSELIKLKKLFENSFSSFENDLNQKYTEFGNNNLIENGRVTEEDLNFSKDLNLSDNTISLNMLELRENPSPEESLKASIFSGFKQADTQYMYSESLFDSYQENMDSVSKVNLDEEMVNILKWQRAYEANAAVIRTMDEILKTTINLKS